ncbi:acetate/propionate family kinase [Paracraurococcus ruber]|uniref:Acetate kinase n=1 Tax=Paracraurococcus ruber TaxID=77675 RepID=A0ABS1D3Z4_9PROT|nr:acetate/propionate family kinase [Paracraurococcus ruber]MBK1661325.1 acetate kinase [Paracraurococcus ruber]TDG23081.1 acetate/propionate family kinase [Paracraurococcus ruber]
MRDGLIGVLNAGSSSLKFAVFAGEDRLLSGQVDGIGVNPRARAKDAAGQAVAPPRLDPPPSSPAAVVPALIPWLRDWLGTRRIAAIGHRVVHGGTRHAAPVRATPQVIEALEALVPLAPLHEPHNLAPIKALLALDPELPQVACFDTAFHRTVPEVAQAFALPLAMFREGIRRYGFHGLSYEYIASVLPRIAPRLAAGRCVVAHLGSGASACALLRGESQATTMGFTALDGLPMGTRSGELDAGVVLHLIQQRGMDAAQIQDLLYRQSGMLGLSGGLSPDFRDLLGSEDPRAAFAVEVFCYRAARQIASLACALGGLDGVVFTAGVGENAAPVRARICAALGWLGLRLDPAANAAHGPRISAPGSAVEAWVVPTDEERMIARHTAALALGG